MQYANTGQWIIQYIKKHKITNYVKQFLMSSLQKIIYSLHSMPSFIILQIETIVKGPNSNECYSSNNRNLIPKNMKRSKYFC